MRDLKSMVEQIMDAIPRRDFGTIRQMRHPEFSFTDSDGQRREGPEAGIDVADMYTRAFPDLKFEIQRMHLAGNIVITEYTARGTHKGDLMGISPTNRQAIVHVCNITEIRDGKVYSVREYFDKMHLMQQLGIEVGHAHA